MAGRLRSAEWPIWERAYELLDACGLRVRSFGRREYVVSEDGWETPEFYIERERAEIELLVTAEKYHRDLTNMICDLVTKKEARFKLNSYALIELFSKLAARFPEASFAIRGRGEDIRDIWLREYAEGKNTFALGPPEGAGL